MGVGLGCSLFAAAACASPPREIVARADAAVLRARQERAEMYAPLPMRKAEEKLELSKKAMAGGANVQARRYAEQAALDADVAMASAGKAKTEQTVQQLADTVQMLEKEMQK